MCVKLKRGGTGGGDKSLGGNSGASGACCDWAERLSRFSFDCFSRLGGNGGGTWKLLCGFGTFTCGDIGNGPNSCVSIAVFDCFGLVG